MNEKITLGKYSILLESIRASVNGYTFKYKYLNNRRSHHYARVQIEGFEMVAAEAAAAGWRRKHSGFREIPTGKLHVVSFKHLCSHQ